MTAFEATLGGAWYHGLRVGGNIEAVELFLILFAFFGTLAVVYYIQRWIGDY